MLYYEFRKLFEKRKLIVLMIMAFMISGFMIYVMCRMATRDSHVFPAFEEYLAYYRIYGMAILYMIVFISVSCFAIEQKSNMEQILQTLQLGRRPLVETKILISIIVTNILVFIFIVFSVAGYATAFDFNFRIPIIEEYDTIYATTGVNTSGKMMLVNTISFVIASNFTSLFSMYLSARLKNSYLACILMFLGCFMTLFGLNPGMGIFFSLIPPGNYMATADGLHEVLRIGSFCVTLHTISLMVTMIISIILLMKIRNLYQVKK